MVARRADRCCTALARPLIESSAAGLAFDLGLGLECTCECRRDAELRRPRAVNLVLGGDVGDSGSGKDGFNGLCPRASSVARLASSASSGSAACSSSGSLSDDESVYSSPSLRCSSTAPSSNSVAPKGRTWTEDSGGTLAVSTHSNRMNSGACLAAVAANASASPGSSPVTASLPLPSHVLAPSAVGCDGPRPGWRRKLRGRWWGYTHTVMGSGGRNVCEVIYNVDPLTHHKRGKLVFRRNGGTISLTTLLIWALHSATRLARLLFTASLALSTAAALAAAAYTYAWDETVRNLEPG